MIASITWADKSGKVFRSRVEQQTKYPHNLLFTFESTEKSLGKILSAKFFRKSDPVQVLCSGGIETLTREKAVEKYQELAARSKGRERDRYIRILEQLNEGESTCMDAAEGTR